MFEVPRDFVFLVCNFSKPFARVLPEKACPRATTWKSPCGEGGDGNRFSEKKHDKTKC